MPTLRRLLPADWRVAYCSRVGESEFSRKMLDFLDAEGIETTHVTRDPRREIGLYAISLKDGERSFTLHMIEHELIMLVATLLLAASHPAAELGWGLPKEVTQSLARSLSSLRSLWHWLTRPLPAS